jgi:hypothetical protein
MRTWIAAALADAIIAIHHRHPSSSSIIVIHHRHPSSPSRCHVFAGSGTRTFHLSPRMASVCFFPSSWNETGRRASQPAIHLVHLI